MLEINVNIEEMFKNKVLMCGDYAFTNYAIQEWGLYGANISGMIIHRIAATRNYRPETEVVDESLNLILDQMKQKFSNMMKKQEYFYSSPVLQTTPVLNSPSAPNSEPQVNLVQRYVEEVQKTLMNVSAKYNTPLCKIAICEMIWEINMVLSYLKSNQYPRFYFQIWHDVAEHTIRVELFDPFDMIPDDKKILGIMVQTKDISVPVEQPKPQEPPKEEDPFEDVPKDEEEDVPSVRKCMKRPRVPKINKNPHGTWSKEAARQRREENLRILYALKQKGIEEVSGICIRGFLKYHTTQIQHRNLLTTLYHKGLIQKSGTTINTRYRLTQKGEEVCASLEPLQLSWLAWFDNILSDVDAEWKLYFYNTLKDTETIWFPYRDHEKHFREYRRLFYSGLIQADPDNGRCAYDEDRFEYTDFGMFVKSEIQNEQEDNDAN